MQLPYLLANKTKAPIVLVLAELARLAVRLFCGVGCVFDATLPNKSVSASSRSWGDWKGGNNVQGFVAMHRKLKTSLEQSRAWKRQLESKLSEFAGAAGDDSNQQQEHQFKALQTDLENAKKNISSLQRQLDDLMD